MIKTIIFDFGDVFINLDKSAIKKELRLLGKIEWNSELENVLNQYETGDIQTSDFIIHFEKLLKGASPQSIIDAWNSILKDFPQYRLDFIKKLSSYKNFQLILLSNTNDLHISWIKEHVSFYEEFKNCFDAFYLSHEINLRKPTSAIFQFVLDKHQILPSETLFIDDTAENTTAAAALGIHTWNNNPVTEDITDLFTTKSDLF